MIPPRRNSLVSNSRRVTFSDVNLAYDSTHGSSYGLVYDEQSLNNAIISILSTKVGSRVFRRTFGSNVLNFLFDPISDSTATSIKFEIISAIGDWEPRVKLIYTSVVPDYENQMYYVELGYLIPALNNMQTSFNFNLDPKTVTSN